jgi:glutathione S-transferase
MGAPDAARPLFHIATVADWERAQADGAYRMSTLGRHLDEVGFIHLACAEQVEGVAARFYRGRTGLVLLEIDPARLTAPVRVEPVPGSTERFPHLYGELPVEAVRAVRPFNPG